ncbi:MAG: cupin domain-containing protein [Haloferacaceae archaeon]
MDGRVSVVDPATLTPAEPVSRLAVRTPFRRRDVRFDLIDAEVGEPSAWHRRDGALFGWVRAGRGWIEYGPGSDDAVTVAEGDFVRIPAGAVHRYVAAGASLSVLAVAAGGLAISRADAPTAGTAVEPTVVGPADLVPTVESANLTRETPFPDAEGMLTMRVRAAGGAAAGWHHHGQNVYFGYAVDGPSETEYGPTGDEVARIERGECFHVPAGLVHRDTNPSGEPHTGIIWLRGGEPWVVNVDGPG